MHAPDFRTIKIGTVCGALVFYEDFTVVIKFNENMLPAYLNIIFKPSETSRTAQVNLFLREFNDFSSSVAVFDGELQRVALLLSDFVFNQGINEAAFGGVLGILNTLENGVDVANLSILFQGKFEDGFTDNYFVTVIEFRLYYPVFIYKCTIGAIHVEDMIDAINILNLAVR
jgi:hypothetical protein